MLDLSRLTRRDFFKLAGAGFLSFSTPLASAIKAGSGDVYGRVIETPMNVFDQPSHDAKIVKTYFPDTVLPITDVTMGGQTTDYNRIWYGFNHEGYVYSGNIQPVQININSPVSQMPAQACLAEVTVPFTDAQWWLNNDKAIACRLYYATTHWVKAVTTDKAGKIWYSLYDEKIRAYYHVQSSHMRLISSEELTPLSPQIPPEKKLIEIRLTEQLIIAYEFDRAVFMARTATGAKFRNGDYTTPSGWHSIVYKKPSRHMAAGDRAAANSYDLPGIPWVSYFTEDGVAFHGTFWHNDFGKPRSHGCVNLTPQAARWVYLWTTPVVMPEEDKTFKDGGTLVHVI
jgi:lipoprotein-anchoring transpeptidase ErfK/SrfK